MFNVFLYDRLTTKISAEEAYQQKEKKTVSAQNKLREKLAKMNRIRIKKRIQQMSAEPVPISRKEYSIELPNFKGDRFIRHRPKDDKERIKDAEVSNLWLDTVPILPSPHNFRPRLKDKEIHSDMKFTPRDRYERIADVWNNQKDFLNSSWKVNNLESSKNSISASERFPNTHRKSYYKTDESVALDLLPIKKFTALPLVKRNSNNL